MLILFAPGAGAPSTSGWIRAWKTRLESFATVVPLDYPYMLAKKRAPLSISSCKIPLKNDKYAISGNRRSSRPWSAGFPSVVSLWFAGANLSAPDGRGR